MALQGGTVAKRLAALFTLKGLFLAVFLTVSSQHGASEKDFGTQGALEGSVVAVFLIDVAFQRAFVDEGGAAGLAEKRSRVGVPAHVIRQASFVIKPLVAQLAHVGPLPLRVGRKLVLFDLGQAPELPAALTTAEHGAVVGSAQVKGQAVGLSEGGGAEGALVRLGRGVG